MLRQGDCGDVRRSMVTMHCSFLGDQSGRKEVVCWSEISYAVHTEMYFGRRSKKKKLNREDYS